MPTRFAATCRAKADIPLVDIRVCYIFPENGRGESLIIKLAAVGAQLMYSTHKSGITGEMQCGRGHQLLYLPLKHFRI